METLTDKSKRAQCEEMLLHGDDPTVLNELIEYEILESNERIAKKLLLLKPPRTTSSNTPVHYDLIDQKNLPKLHDGFLVQVTLHRLISLSPRYDCFSSVNISNIV